MDIQVLNFPYINGKEHNSCGLFWAGKDLIILPLLLTEAKAV